MAVELAERAVRERRVPKELKVRLAGPRAAELARELIRKGIVSRDQVEVVGEERRRPLAVPV
jgi:flagellar motor protein MotB